MLATKTVICDSILAFFLIVVVDSTVNHLIFTASNFGNFKKKGILA